MTLAPSLAQRMGRSELARGRGEAAVRYAPNAAGIAAGRGQPLASVRTGFEATTGVVSMGLLMGIAVGIALFYIWTRGHQA